NSSILALPDRRRHLRSRGVSHGDKANEGKVLFDLRVVVGRRGRVQQRVRANVVDAGQGNDTETTVAVGDNLTQKHLRELRVDRYLFSLRSNHGVGASLNNCL